MRHFLSIREISREEIEGLLDSAQEMGALLRRDIAKAPALRGKSVATLFFEPSTRTRLSFEKAAKTLSADVISFSPGTSSLSKGESLKDTVRTIQAFGVDLMVVRHQATGAPWRVAEWVDVPVINGGDGAHEHPTQALLDALTLRQHFGNLTGIRVGIVGDIKHSRVARSNVQLLSMLGASVTLVAPPTLLPAADGGWPAAMSSDFDEVLADLDAVYLLRVQTERGGGSVFPSLAEYTVRFGLTEDRFARLKPHSVILHPGPMIRGVEIAPSVADDPRTLVLDQVQNGVAARMAVLYHLLGGDR